jgi:hypothetical protein
VPPTSIERHCVRCVCTPAVFSESPLHVSVMSRMCGLCLTHALNIEKFGHTTDQQVHVLSIRNRAYHSLAAFVGHHDLAMCNPSPPPYPYPPSPINLGQVVECPCWQVLPLAQNLKCLLTCASSAHPRTPCTWRELYPERISREGGDETCGVRSPCIPGPSPLPPQQHCAEGASLVCWQAPFNTHLVVGVLYIAR